MQPPAPTLSAAPFHTVFSPCGRYRHVWFLRWAEGPCVMFIGLNPSRANGHRTDATVKRCIAYAKRWGYGAVRIVNLFAWVATAPAAMMRAANPVGPGNDRHLEQDAAEADLIVAVWGVHGSHLGRDRAIKARFRGRLHALKVNQDGSPAHPLYLRTDLRPIPFA
ncbi:DUF1643 domain-containing protein [Luteolibacter marinus]|uniref:DUF1643 domain-containing protein n=1 Tax=Luteolibacter marinus TaxID=2776705 RepID=UPI0018696A34|nr:DUF1643 domain-containing protein [Luteolibacter marinus]